MPILNIVLSQVGVVGVDPSIAYIATNDTIAEVTTAGYLNKSVAQDYAFTESMMALVSTKTTPSAASTQVAWVEVSHSGSNWSLVPTGSPGSVVLPTIANHIAVYTNTTGELSEDAATAINGGNIQAGLSATAGYFASFPATAARGSLRLVAANSAGDTVTQITNASQAAARVYTIPDGGQAASSFLLTDSGGTQTIATGSVSLTLGNITAAAGNIAATLGSVSAGTTVTGGTGVIATTGNVTASAGNLVAGATGAAGTVTSFAGTGANEFVRLTAINNTAGDFSVTVSNAASIGQSQTISIPDVGAATGNFLLSGLTGAGIQHITSGSLEVDAGSLLSGIGTGGFVGLIKAFPTTATSGFIAIQAAINASGDFGTTIRNATAQAQAQVVTIPDVGSATGNFIMSSNVATSQSISSDLIVSGGFIQSGLAGTAGTVISFPATAANGQLILAAVNAGADFDTTISNAASVAQDQVITIPDSGAATANFLLDTGTANILAMQEFVGISEVLTFGTGTWTVTRIAQGNYVSRHTPADETSIVAIDITPQIRVAASKGFRLDSFDYMYAIAANALDAHTAVLDRIAYANNVAVSVTSVPITATLATATQANPYLTNCTVTTPAFDVTADSKYVLEITVNNAAASEFDFYGIMLRFSQTIG